MGQLDKGALRLSPAGAAVAKYLFVDGSVREIPVVEMFPGSMKPNPDHKLCYCDGAVLFSEGECSPECYCPYCHRYMTVEYSAMCENDYELDDGYDPNDPEIHDLHVQYGVPRRVYFEREESGGVLVTLQTGMKCCVVSLRGGQIRWCLSFLSNSIHQVQPAPHGGVPIIFPWFGSHPEETEFPRDGFARHQDWSLVSFDVEDDFTRLILELTHTPESLKIWPEFFRLRQEIALSERELTQTLKVTNTGSQPWTWAGGLYPYFKIDGISYTQVLDPSFKIGGKATMQVLGLESASYVDLNSPEYLVQNSELFFEDEVNRAYLCESKELLIGRRGQVYRLSVQCRGVNSVVVWNPDPLMAKRKYGFTALEPKNFLCVAPMKDAHVQDWEARSVLKPGESAELSYEVSQVKPDESFLRETSFPTA